MFANKMLSITLIESLPKEKTAVLGTAELCLFKKFLKYFTKETPDSVVPECPLTIREVLPIVYANTKLLGPDTTTKVVGSVEVKIPEIILEISISRPLIEATALQHGVFVNLNIEDLHPLPEEWSIKEGNDKDLNSSNYLLIIDIYTYTLNIHVPSDKEAGRVIIIPNGNLIMTQEALATG